MHHLGNNAYLDHGNFLMQLCFQRKKKDLRTIILTPYLSTIAEEFIVVDYIKPAVLRDLDTNQYGAIQKLSTPFPCWTCFMIGLMALIDWSNGTDIKAVFNYCKAFD